MPAVSANFGDLITPGLKKIFTEQYDQLPEMRTSLFNVISSDRAYEKESTVGAFGDMPTFNGTISYDDVYQGYNVTYTPAEFAKGFKVERKLFDDDLYNVINRKPRGLAISAQRTQEKHAASVFQGAFAGSGTIVVDGITILTNSEGLSLCHAAHTSTASSTTQNNTGTSALSDTAVEATRIAMAAFRDDRDNLISIQADMILCGRAKEQVAWEIISTKGKVDTAENNANFHYGKYKLAVWDFLPGTAWFMIDSNMMKMFLQWYERIPLEFFQDKSFDTLIAKFASYARWAYGWSDWRWLYGHNATS